MAKRKAEEAEVEIDPFFGLDDLPVGDSLLKDDDYHGAESPDAANENDQVEMTNATAPAVIDEITTAEDDASLPPWMRAAHASVIAAKTPSTKDLGLDPRLLTALKKKLGVRRCFPVQAAVIPVVLGAHAGRCAADVCVCAPTGSGKTLAYALPVVQALLPRVVTRLRALVLLPTRGLAAQVHDIFAALVEGTPLRVGLAAAHDGISFERERASLLANGASGAGNRGGGASSAVDILVATPGRLVEHLQCPGGGFTLQHLRLLVVDEADRLISGGYQGWLQLVLDAAHSGESALESAPMTTAKARLAPGSSPFEQLTRRPALGGAAAVARGPPLAMSAAEPPLLKMLFSATLTRSAAKLAPFRLCRPRYFCVAGARYATPSTLKEWMLTCADAHEKLKLLVTLLRCVLDRAHDADVESRNKPHKAKEGKKRKAAEAVAKAKRDQKDESASESEDGALMDAYDEEEGEEENQEDMLRGQEQAGVGRPEDKDGQADVLDEDEQDVATAGADKVIVFTSSLESTHRLTRLLQLLLRIDVGEFSSAVPPRERTALLKAFKSRQLRVLVASDAMARGMDVEGVDAVINYDPPANIKGYVHRVGRTARAGRAGTSYTLLRTSEVHHFKRSMAKASKAWRPLELPEQQAALGALSGEYDQALDELQAALQAERSGELASTSSRVALEEAIGKQRRLRAEAELRSSAQAARGGVGVEAKAQGSGSRSGGGGDGGGSSSSSSDDDDSDEADSERFEGE